MEKEVEQRWGCIDRAVDPEHPDLAPLDPVEHGALYANIMEIKTTSRVEVEGRSHAQTKLTDGASKTAKTSTQLEKGATRREEASKTTGGTLAAL